MSDNLDITNFKQEGEALKIEIAHAVKSTQSVLVQPYPSFITMTVKQYQDLQHDPEMKQMYNSKDHMYATPYNVMEVVIK